MADREGRNFRSFYYETLGLKNVEQKKALEILLRDDEIDVDRVATFCSRFSLPAVYRSHVWKLLLDVIPPYQDAHSYVSLQRLEQFKDLKHALIVIQQIGAEDEDITDLISKMFVMQEGGFRLITVPERLQRQVQILQAVVKVFVDMFEDEVDLYWISMKFVKLQQQFIGQWDNMIKLIQHYVQAEDGQLWKHLTSFHGFDYLPYQRWFESSFAEDLSDSCMERIWDKIVAGSSKVLGIVGVALLLDYRHSLLNVKDSEAMATVLNKPCPVDRCVVIVNKAMELWDKHGNAINSEVQAVHR